MIDLSTYRKVIICQLVGSKLQFFTGFCNAKRIRTKTNLQRIDSFIRFAKRPELITKLRSSYSLLDFDFTSQSFEIVNILRTFIFLDSQKLHIEYFLVCLLQECNQKFTSSQYLWFQYGVKESLVSNWTFSSLIIRQFLLCRFWKWWNDCLGVRSEQVVS